MSKKDIYQLLEQKMLSYRDYMDIPVIPEEDEVGFVPVQPSTVLGVNPMSRDSIQYTGNEIMLRSAVADKLYWAGQELKTLDKHLQLELVYGYRALEVQEELFQEARSSLAAEYDDEQELLAAAHRQIAVPDVAGHPTGGAVDVHILRDGEPVGMGTKVWDYSTRDAFTFSPFISREAWENRQLLRRAMMAAGFAPFDGEWWHFSYGDKEWAKYYGKEGALYGQVAAQDIDIRKTIDELSSSTR
ncbi:M15 family metallopeptidase [Nocardia sp. NPDC050697]|uniref:M15 family metallopeptidase n=1 Tax=Nocardia sp. NPDC050697 TaxID=3155158 RepID=UPI0033EB3F22